MHRRVLLPALGLVVAACTDQLPTGPGTPNYDIADATTAYKSGFYWLPPMVAAPSHSGTFDSGLSPTVEICELNGDACGLTIAAYTMSAGPNGEVIKLSVEDEHYHVNWHTNEFELSSTKLYRVSIRAGVQNVLLGFADVQPVSNGSRLKNVDTDEYIGLVDGRTLPIKFRIEKGIIGAIAVHPVEADAEPGATQQFVAIVADLHDQIMSATVVWSSSNEAVARIDQNGLATAIADGTVTITASAERISGTATLRVEGSSFVVNGGFMHTCLINNAGRAFCWGENSSGQLGNNTNLASRRPVAVVTPLMFKTVSAGDFHTCAISTDDDAYCWGSNFSFQLGAPSVFCRPALCARTPSPVFGGLKFKDISTGGRHSCGATTDGVGYCWGSNEDGNLGTGDFQNASSPRAISGGLTFTSVRAGTVHSCGLAADGAAYCWGRGEFGRLGNGSIANQLRPVAVAGSLTFTQLDVGFRHACALTSEGKAYCWGAGNFGELGNGQNSHQSSPVAVSGDLVFAMITVGGGHTCGITTTGAAYCWGTSRFGRLGDGNMFGPDRNTPVAVSGNLVFANISAGVNHVCAVTVDDIPYCWGDNLSGQMGNGSILFEFSTPQRVAPLP